jgi:N-acetylneuraminate synthase
LDVLSTAWLLGVTVIEKHVTLDKKLKGNDHYHAGDPDDFRKLSNKIQFLKKIYGEESTNWTFECERDARKNARRGVYLSRDVEKGDKLKHEHVAFLRPQLDGISPKQLMNYPENNTVFASNLKKGTQIKKDHLV